MKIPCVTVIYGRYDKFNFVQFVIKNYYFTCSQLDVVLCCCYVVVKVAPDSGSGQTPACNQDGSCSDPNAQCVRDNLA